MQKTRLNVNKDAHYITHAFCIHHCVAILFILLYYARITILFIRFSKIAILLIGGVGVCVCVCVCVGGGGVQYYCKIFLKYTTI
jgi:hypothetical protein